LKEWAIIEGPDYRKSLARVPQVIRETIENSVIPTLKEYPYPVEGKNERKIRKLRDKWEGFYEFKIESYRLIFRANLDSKKVLLVWVKTKPFAY
jgi:mRNA-degrading endonuclease RelE of RelBE toxin-antitoxin system